MKRFLLPFIVLALTLIGCESSNHFSFGDIEFDYPSSWTMTNQDVHDNVMSVIIDANDDGYIFFEIIKNADDAEPDDDAEILEAYLRYNGNRIAEIFIPEDAELEYGPDGEDSFVYTAEDDMIPEAAAFAAGTSEGRQFYSAIRSMFYDDKYAVTVYAQAGSENDVDKIIEKTYMTVHEK